MKEIIVDPAIGESGKWAEGVRRAIRILELIRGPTTDLVTAGWLLTSDEQGGPILALTLSDGTVSVEGRFPPEDLQDAERLWTRLHRLWDDLLRVRIERLLGGVREALQASEG